MAQYRLLEKTFINNSLQEAGAIIEYDGQPGSTMQPVETTSKVDIPENWRDQNGLQRIALAKSLGAPPLRLSAAMADEWIANELANRDLAKKNAEAKKVAVPSITDQLLRRSTDDDKPAQAAAADAAAKKAADDAAKAKADAEKTTN